MSNENPITGLTDPRLMQWANENNQDFEAVSKVVTAANKGRLPLNVITINWSEYVRLSAYARGKE